MPTLHFSCSGPGAGPVDPASTEVRVQLNDPAVCVTAVNDVCPDGSCLDVDVTVELIQSNPSPSPGTTYSARLCRAVSSEPESCDTPIGPTGAETGDEVTDAAVYANGFQVVGNSSNRDPHVTITPSVVPICILSACQSAPSISLSVMVDGSRTCVASVAASDCP